MALQEPALEVPYFALRCAHRGRRAAPQAERPVASFFGCACTDPALPLNGTAPEWMVLPPCSWYMTWFAHDVPSLPQIARLFDLFLSSHPSCRSTSLPWPSRQASAGVEGVGVEVGGGVDDGSTLARTRVGVLLCADLL